MMEGGPIMGQVVDITALIVANKERIAAERNLKRIEAELLAEGDKVHENETHRLVVKNGKIKFTKKIDPEAGPDDLSA
jgi:hypothetical protein